MKNKLLILINIRNSSFDKELLLKCKYYPINQNTILKNKSVLIENGKIIEINDFKKLNLDKTEK
jgi:hypothetical protein